MATSGSKKVIVTQYDNLIFEWNTTSQSVANNTSTISWTLKLESLGSGRIDSSVNKYWEVVIDNKASSGYVSIAIGNNETKVLASGTSVLNHNADGSKTFSYRFHQTFGITFNGIFISSKEGSGTGTLNPLTTVTPYIKTAPNFTDVDNPTITYAIPSSILSVVTSLQACISLTGSTDDVPYRPISIVTNGSYTFSLTQAERNTLTNAITSGTSRTVKFYIKGVSNGKSFQDSVSKTFSIAGANPVLNPTVKDINTYTKNLTGDENTLVRYMSTAKVEAGASFHNTAQAASYKITNADSTINNSSGSFSSVESEKFVFTVTDTRGLTATETITMPMINYVKLTCHLQIEPPSADSGELSLKISGKFFNGSFGAISNTLMVHYRYKKDDGSYSSWLSPYVEWGDDEYLAEATITGLDYTSGYTLEARAADALETVYTPETKVKTSPVFDWSENDFNFNVPVNINGNVTIGDSNILAVGYAEINHELAMPDYASVKAGGFVLKDAFRGTSKRIGNQRILWEGALHMNGNQEIELNQTIGEQINGICLIFSLLTNDVAQNTSFQSFYIPKFEVQLHEGAPHTFLLGINSGFSVMGAKYLYISDKYIVGHATNTASGTNSGISYNNSRFVLRYVIGF